MVSEDRISFDSNIIKNGNSWYLRLPPKIFDYIEGEKGADIKIQAENGDYGPYISAWNPEQQEQVEQDG